jgi:hypothetical protein
LEIASREVLKPGDPVRVEVSLGPLADEVVLEARVAAIEPGRQPEDAPTVLVRILAADLQRVRYVHDVTRGKRRASARQFHRVRKSMAVRWRQGQDWFGSHTWDLSKGGAFIVADRIPAAGEPLDLELVPSLAHPALRLEAKVAWRRDQGDPIGFGVRFDRLDRDVAGQLHTVVQDAMAELGTPR